VSMKAMRSCSSGATKGTGGPNAGAGKSFMARPGGGKASPEAPGCCSDRAAECGLVGTSRTRSLKNLLKSKCFLSDQGDKVGRALIQGIGYGCNLAIYLSAVAQAFGEAAWPQSVPTLSASALQQSLAAKERHNADPTKFESTSDDRSCESGRPRSGEC
jgi:hypothetical protein